jgi:hypothetical protein
MGRPLKQKFFDPIEGTVLIGGEAVSTLSFSNRGEVYYSANVAITLGAPNLPTGTQATVGTIALFGNGAINTFTVAGGTGYTTAPTVTITGANTTPAVATSTLVYAAVTNVIATSAFIPAANGGSSAVIGDIVKQVGARRYKVRTAQGVGKCKLVTAAPAAGQMTIAATDSQSSTYYVKKLNESLCVLIQNSGSGFDYTDGTVAKWTITGSAVAPSGSDIGTVVISSN